LQLRNGVFSIGNLVNNAHVCDIGSIQSSSKNINVKYSGPLTKIDDVNVATGGGEVDSEPTASSQQQQQQQQQQRSFYGAGEAAAEIRNTGQVKIRVVTWNMYGQQPPPIHLLRDRLIPKNKVYILALEDHDFYIAF
jgi:hypothetical protein